MSWVLSTLLLQVFLQTTLAIGVLSSSTATAAAGGAYTVVVNALLPGIGQLILGGLIGLFVVAVTFCAASQQGQ